MAKHNGLKTNKSFPAFFKRTRIWLVLLGCLPVCIFVLPPLIFNGGLASISEDVFAAPLPTLSPIPSGAPTAAPLSELSTSPLLPAVTPVPTATITDIEIIEYPTLHPQTTHSSVARLQARLMELGYFDYDETTEYYGAVTQSAVQLFQRSYGMEETGVATTELQELLFSESARPYHMTEGHRGSDVKGLQRRLHELGYYEEKDNGYFGVATEEAVRAFQKKNKIEETGIVTQSDNDLIFSPKAKYKIDPTPTPTPKATKTPKPSSTPKPTAKPKATATPKASGNSDIPILDTPPPYIGLIPDGTVYDDVPEPTVTPPPSSGQTNYGSGIEGMLAAAHAQLGKPYILGEEGPDAYDCSGFVYYCMRQAGLNAKRYNAAGFSEMESWQPITSVSALQRGDLVFYTSNGGTRVSHVAIYMGNGQIIHAATSAGRVLTSDCTTPYYITNFVIGRRVF